MDINEILPETQNDNRKGNKNKSFELKYSVLYDLSKIKIFGKAFVENNKDKCHLIIGNNDCELTEFYTFQTKGEKSIILVIDEENINFSEMFKAPFSNCLADISSLKNLDTSECTNLYGMFCGCKKIKNFKCLKDWDVSKCKNFSRLFEKCSFSEIDFLSNWNMSNSTDLSFMFSKCKNLNNIKGIKNWNVENIINFGRMFYGCRNLKDVNDLQNWNMNKAQNIDEMFSNCTNLVNMDSLYKWKLNDSVNKENVIYGCDNLLNFPSIFKNANTLSCKIF